MKQFNIFGEIDESPKFYNTIHEGPKELAESISHAATQEDRVLAYFRQVKQSTALMAAEKLGMHEISCRRSVTNLFNDGKLIKTREQIVGKYGKPNHVYRIVDNSTSGIV